MYMVDGVDGQPPEGSRRFTKKEIHAARQIASSIVKAGAQGAILHRFTMECVNAYDLPGYPADSEERIQIFGILLELAQEIIRNEPPPQPNTWNMIKHVVG